MIYLSGAGGDDDEDTAAAVTNRTRDERAKPLVSDGDGNGIFHFIQ